MSSAVTEARLGNLAGGVARSPAEESSDGRSRYVMAPRRSGAGYGAAAQARGTLAGAIRQLHTAELAEPRDVRDPTTPPAVVQGESLGIGRKAARTW